MIRKAEKKDISRIAEILVFVKRINYRDIFNDDDFSFNELQVLKVAEEYLRPEMLNNIFVYDDGIVKGMLHMEGTEIAELYVDNFFQNQGIGARLMEYAVRDHNADRLWVIEKNVKAVRFYEAHGFRLSGERKCEEGTEVFIGLMVR